MNLDNKKLQKLLCCPKCKSPTLKREHQKINCEECGESYSLLFDTPVLIRSDSPVLDWYKPKKDSTPSTRRGFRDSLLTLYRRLKPEARVWSVKSQKAMQALLEEKNPDFDDNAVVLIGAGFESVFRRITKPYQDIIRLGLVTRGEVELFSDICELPLVGDGLDLVLSSSVLEHVYDPEQAVAEMFRVLKPGGYVYAEIPFMRAYHMIPIDYQRYTISGIEKLFERHGFTLISKGICSGPFTAAILFFINLSSSLLSFSRYLEMTVSLVLSVILHPVKYLDRCFEDSKWAEVSACNFYYIGKKGAAREI